MPNQIKEFTPENSGIFWPIEAIGHRPEDYMIRDNLFASLIRDHRGKLFQAMLRKPPPWLPWHVERLASEDRPAALQVLCLQLLYQRQFRDVLDLKEQTWIDRRNKKPIVEAQQCWPRGALVKPADKKSKKYLCHRPRFCPWCHARKVAQLFKHVHDKLIQDPQGKVLVRARVGVSSESIDPTIVNFWFKYMHQGKAKFDYDFFLCNEAHYVSQELKLQLRDRAQYLGLQGGLLTHQVGPWRYRTGGFGFQHVLGLLGEISFSSIEDANQFIVDKFLKIRSSLLWIGKEYQHIEWLALPAGEPQALRFLLAGTSASYDVGKNLPLVGQPDTKPNGDLTDGLAGLLSLEPTYLIRDDRIVQYAQAVK